MTSYDLKLIFCFAWTRDLILKSATYYLQNSIDGVDLETIPRIPWNRLAGPHVELAGTAHDRRAVVVDVAEEFVAVGAVDSDATALDAPVIEGLEKGAEFIFLHEAELGIVYSGEGESVLVSRLEVCFRRKQVSDAEVEVSAASAAAVRHHRRDRRRNTARHGFRIALAARTSQY